MAVQRSLFPDAFEVQAAALSAMRDLEVPRALQLVRRARQLDPRLVDLDVLEEILLWLRPRLEGRPEPERLAEVLCGLTQDCLAGRLTAAGVAFGDEVIARYVARRALGGRSFLDDGERVHLGMLDLVRGRSSAARGALRKTLASGHGHRADLWGHLGDACLELGRNDEANACHVRALLLSAPDLDLVRVHRRQLADLHQQLARAYSAAAARELLLPHAWLAGVLAIPARNGWLDAHLSRLRARAAVGPGAPLEQRYRRFGLLLYLDCSRPAGTVDLAQREEMEALDGELFARYMAECRRREEPGEPSLRPGG